MEVLLRLVLVEEVMGKFPRGINQATSILVLVEEVMGKFPRGINQATSILSRSGKPTTSANSTGRIKIQLTAHRPMWLCHSISQGNPLPVPKSTRRQTHKQYK
jgi:hypothetical protein